jgi:integrase/recombinase XerD
MARKITMNGQSHKPLNEIFDDFVVSQTAKGLSEVTIATYHRHLRSMSYHLDIQKPLDALTQKDLESMIVSMRNSGLAHNTISSYCRVLRTFLNWCKRNGMKVPELPNIKDKETVKESYTDEELLVLLKRPPKNCTFCEFRNWVIVNFLMNCGCRSSSIRNIQNRDVDLETRQIILRHNKNGKIQAVPLCSLMVSILREYMQIRGGKPEDYLFCDQYGGMFSRNGLKLAIAHHNKSRGVEKTSAHLYRHTFARKYLVDCGGDPFMLQKLLGHSTLKMTRHYCAIYDTDVAKNFDNFSPLAHLNPQKEKVKKKK